MGRIRLAALILVALLAWPAVAQEAVFRVDVKLVRLLAAVKDEAGKPVPSLTKDDFQIFDNGVRQELKVFERHTAQPLSIALLIDTSGSTAKDLKYETESVGRFVKALFREGNPQDSIALIGFNWEVRMLTGFVRRASQVERQLVKLKGEAGTALYDAIYLASDELQPREGRHVIVVVTDGGDTVSAKGFHEALEAAHRADAVIYSILVIPILNDAGRNVGGENALTSLSASTGGKVFFPASGPALDAAFEEILRDLRTQYLLGYYPKGVPLTKEPFHKVQIKTTRPALRVTSRTGYYGDFESKQP